MKKLRRRRRNTYRVGFLLIPNELDDGLGGGMETDKMSTPP
jgi:hypothetical protein